MTTDRHMLLAGLSAALAAPVAARAASLTDDAGRPVNIPKRVDRVFAAGPPASILLYTFAPDLLLGWTRRPEPAQCEFLGAGACDKPEVGRLTGRGNTTNLEVLLKLKPDLVIDVGTINGTCVSLANRVQAQIGVPYALLDAVEPAFAAGVRTDPVWKPIEAAQTGRVYPSPTLPFGWVDFPPSVNRLIGLWWLAKALYPDRFPEQMRPITCDSYGRFYHMSPTEARCAGWTAWIICDAPPHRGC